MAFGCMAFIRFSIAGLGMFSANLSVCVICASDLLGVVYNELDNLWCMFLLDSHLSVCKIKSGHMGFSFSMFFVDEVV